MDALREIHLWFFSFYFALTILVAMGYSIARDHGVSIPSGIGLALVTLTVLAISATIVEQTYCRTGTDCKEDPDKALALAYVIAIVIGVVSGLIVLLIQGLWSLIEWGFHRQWFDYMNPISSKARKTVIEIGH